MLRVRFGIAIILCAISLTIGYQFSDDPYIDGWQFWVWAVCSILICAMFITHRITFKRNDLFISLALFSVALLFRATFVGLLPGMLHVDEVGVAEFARDLLINDKHQFFNMFVTGPSSQPAMFHYIIHYTMALVGNSIFGLRFSSAIAGSLGVLTTYWMIKIINNRKIAIVTAVLMVVYHFSVHYSRIGLNNIWDTIWVPLVVVGFYKAWMEYSKNGAVVCGIALGLSQYFYHGSKICVFLILFLMIILWKQNKNIHKRTETLLIIGFITLCIAGPIFMFLLTEPGKYFARAAIVLGWKPDDVTLIFGEVKYFQYLLRQINLSFGTYTYFPDANGFYGPGIPLVYGPAALIFIFGLVISFTERNWIPLAWLLLTTLLGGFLINVPNSSAHYVVSIPAICWVIGYGLNWLKSQNHSRLAAVLLVLILLVDIYFYFIQYPSQQLRDFIHAFPPLTGP